MTSVRKPFTTSQAKRKLADISKDATDSDSTSSSASSSASLVSDSDSDPGSGDSHETKAAPDEPVLSHAEKRRQKKRKLNSGDAAPVDISSESRTKPTSTLSGPRKGENKEGKKPGKVSEGSDTRRQNSVWVGNLAYKTTAVALKNFFEGLEVTRVHMPLKAPPNGAGPKVNSGFAYVDFATPNAKLVAITFSERNLEGRRLLIKDGEDFAGRPTTAAAVNEGGTAIITAAAAAPTSKPGAPKTGLTKTAQKILTMQKQPPGPTLFFGNLGFEATESSIRQLLEAHRTHPAQTPAKNGGDESSDGGEESGVKVKSEGKALKEDKWIRKIRMGTFEDSGKCKGWAFVDFTSTEHATSALINPRNHSLDGRKLTVEYASPDAVRRGGGPREADSHKHKAVEERGELGKRIRKPKSAGYIRKKPKSAAGQLTKDGEKKLNKKERKAEKQQRRADKLEKKRVENKLERGPGVGSVERASAGKNERPKPGAALAAAERGSAAILPSQGQKITF